MPTTQHTAGQEQQDATQCITCKTALPPGTKIEYFSQSPLCPKKDDLDYGAEITWMLEYLHTLFKVITYVNDLSHETIISIGNLGFEVAEEAQRRMKIYEEAVTILSTKAEALQRAVDS